MKIVLNDVASAANVSVMNSNFQKIEDALNNQVLYRENVLGEPNSMEDNLDMNSKRLYNLTKPVTPTDAARLQDVLDMQSSLTPAELIPIKDEEDYYEATNVEDALQEIGAELALPGRVINGTSYTDVFTPTVSQTEFELTGDPGSVHNLDVVLYEVPQINGVDFTLDGTTLVMTVAPGLPPSPTKKLVARYGVALPIGSGNAQDIIYEQDGADAVPTSVEAVLRRTVHVEDFGARPDPGFDNTDAFLAAKVYCIDNLPITLRFGKGVYEYKETGNWAYAGLTLEGEGMFATKLKCLSTTSEHTALLFNAFISGSPSAPFVDDCNVRHLTVEGNAQTLRVIRAQGISRSRWVDVGVRSAKTGIGYGFLFEGCSLNSFDHLACVNFPADPFESLLQYGLYLKNGFRAGSDIGQCTNNVFINRHMEYIPVGTFLELADNNTFVGGTDESCTIYGLVCGPGSRFNTFIGSGWENGDSGATGDLVDSGFSNSYLNCYSLHKIILQGRNCKLEGGIHKDIEVQAGSVKNIVQNCTVKYPVGSTVGFTDEGTATEWKNIYDERTTSYVYPLKPRVLITPTGSPFTWVNTTGQYVSFIVQSGTISETLIYRDGVSFVAPTGAPQIYLLAPTDRIRLTYSVAPAISYLPQNGFQG